MFLAMVDAALLPKHSFFWRLAAVDNGHVPVWARTGPTLDVTRKPIPKRVLTLNIQMDSPCWHRAEMTKAVTLLDSREKWHGSKLLQKIFSAVKANFDLPLMNAMLTQLLSHTCRMAFNARMHALHSSSSFHLSPWRLFALITNELSASAQYFL